MARLRVHVYPNRLTTFRYPVSYHDSLPRLGPVAISGWRFFFVTPARSCCRVSFRVRIGIRTTLPSTSFKSTTAPSPKSDSTAMTLGRRTAKLFPHFRTVAFIVSTKKIRHLGQRAQAAHHLTDLLLCYRSLWQN